MMPALNIPNVDVSMAARQYVSAGWMLVPIAKGSKGPRHTGWNEQAHCIDSDTRATKVRGGIGLAHAYSGTCCIDLDDLKASTDWLFDEHLVDITRLLAAPDAVQILSGRENRAKLLYRLPEGVDPLVTVKIPECGLELRCATREGKTVQDVLPPTIHPTTLMPYRWAGAGRWENLPVLPEVVLEVWRLLAERIDPLRSAGVADGNPEADPVVAHLDAGEWVKAKLRDGTRHIKCPFEADHTTPSSVGDCSYFPALTGGYAQGHFHCLHTHCENRTDEEFLDGVRFDRHAHVAGQFDVVAHDGPVETEVATLVRRALERNKAGKALPTIRNLVAVMHQDCCRMHIARDRFKDSIMWAPVGTADWREFEDDDYTALREQLETDFRFQTIGREVMRDVVSLVARNNQFDSAQTWINALRWDGVPRVARFFSTHFGADDTSYHQAMAIYLWTALAGRVLEPGCKCDIVPILVGPQGAGKSTAIMAMVQAAEHYCEIDFSADEDNLARKMRGTLIAEFAELKGLRSREIEHIKAFITRQHENWTPKFKEFNQTYPRRTVFIGTTNQEEFLADETGNRRFGPVRVGQVNVDAIRCDRLQLWAEAAVLFIMDGVAWMDAERLARDIHNDHMVTDPWEEAIAKWVDEPGQFDEEARKVVGFTVVECLFGALAINSKDMSRANEMRAAAIFRKLGLVKIRKSVGDHRRWKWYCPTSTEGRAIGRASECPF